MKLKLFYVGTAEGWGEEQVLVYAESMDAAYNLAKDKVHPDHFSVREIPAEKGVVFSAASGSFGLYPNA